MRYGHRIITLCIHTHTSCVHIHATMSNTLHDLFPPPGSDQRVAAGALGRHGRLPQGGRGAATRGAAPPAPSPCIARGQTHLRDKGLQLRNFNVGLAHVSHVSLPGRIL